MTESEKLVHKKFDTIIRVLKSAKRINKHIQLVGPAGSFKTTLTKQVAEELGLDYVCFSVGQQTTVSNLLGFINARGEYVSTPLRDAFENGKLICLDEFDSANPSTVTILNSLLSNDICSFPDKMIHKHPNFVCIICCNTYGTGGDINYIGRNRLDASTLDRFVTINIDYDEELEGKLANHNSWFMIIKQIRENIKKYGLKVVVSPRATFQGADLLEAGFKIEEVLDMVVYKGVSDDVKRQLLDNVRIKYNHNNTEKLPLIIDINLQYNNEYQVYYRHPLIKQYINVSNDISIISHTDWGCNYNIMISASNTYLPSLNENTLFLNSVCGNIQIQKKEYIDNFIRTMDTGCIKTISNDYNIVCINLVDENGKQYVWCNNGT